MRTPSRSVLEVLATATFAALAVGPLCGATPEPFGAWAFAGSAQENAAPAADLARLIDVRRTPVSMRRKLAAEVAGSIAPARALEALPVLADPDAAVRAAIVPLFTRPDLGVIGVPERVGALRNLAFEDPAAEVRQAAIRGLGLVGAEEAARALARVARLGRSERDRLEAATVLADAPFGAPVIDAEVRAELDPLRNSGDGALEPRVLAALLGSYGRRLVETSGRASIPPEGSTAPGAALDSASLRDLATLALALRHPARDVRAAAVLAFDEAIRRLEELGLERRGSDVLLRLADLGIERELALYQSARIALSNEGDAAKARTRARELLEHLRDVPGQLARIDAYQSQLWLFRAHLLIGASEFALGNRAAAESGFELAAGAIDRALAERRDLLAPSERIRHIDLLQQRALAELMRTMASVAGSMEPGSQDPERDLVRALERARRAHALHLEAQALRAELRGDALSGFDSLFLSDLSPHRLFFGERGFDKAADGALDRPGLIRLAGEFGRVLGTVAPGELPGFAALRPKGVDEARAVFLYDPGTDPDRRALLERIRDARIEGLDEVIDEAQDLFGRMQERGMGLLPEEEYLTLEGLQRRRLILLNERQNEAPDAREWIRDLRIPSSSALWHAEELSEQGLASEARAIAERLEADIDARGISDWWYVVGHDRVIRARLLIGSTYTDEGDGARAESVVLSAAERIEDLDKELAERGVAEATLEPLRGLLASALVSLAVNANVRLGDPEKAERYYERAYELRKDEFMRVLLACYRARAGRADEARALLRTIRPGPGTWYNLACTHALLGDSEKALEMLGEELARNHATEESRQKQREWAAGDPDLASLRGLARFKRLVRQ